MNDLPRAIALDPGILREDKAMQLLSEILYHVVSLRFSVNKEVQADFFLESNDGLDFFLNELFVLCFGDFTLAKLGTSLTNFFRLLTWMVSICVYNRDA